MCPHTTIHVSSYYYMYHICVHILLKACNLMCARIWYTSAVVLNAYMCPHTAMYYVYIY